MRRDRQAWLYAYIALASWVFVPELRRLVDYRSQFQAFSLIAVLPLAALVPFIVPMVRGGWRAANPHLRLFIGIWFAAFTYGFFVSAAHKLAIAGTYGMAQFCLPAVAAIWFATRPEGAEKTYERVGQFLLICAAVSSVYGIVQFISPPPWDAQWQINADMPSAGEPLPFQIRVYATLNSPGPFGDFIAMAMIMALPLLRAKRPWIVVCYLLCVTAGALSLVRAAWIAFALAVAVYALLVPQRTRIVGTFAAFAGIAIVVGGLIFTFIPSDAAREVLSNRFSTLFDLQHDPSAFDRAETTNHAINQAMANPLGGGLGITGVGERFVTFNGTITLPQIDNGYAARFVELGYPGMIGYLIVVIGALFYTFRVWRLAAASGSHEAASMLASAVAVQVAMLFFDVAGDQHQGLTGLYFWIALGLTTAYAAQTNLAVTAARRRVSYAS